jgi:hypothetical protein
MRLLIPRQPSMPPAARFFVLLNVAPLNLAPPLYANYTVPRLWPEPLLARHAGQQDADRGRDGARVRHYGEQCV